MQIVLALLVSLLPSVLLLLAVWGWLYRRRDPGIFWVAIGFGVAATVAAVVLQLPLLGTAERSVRSGSRSILGVLVVVALIEEAAKYAAWRVCLAIFRRPILTRIGLAAGVGATAALAFATVENLLFNMGITANLHRVIWDVAAARAFATVPLHATSGFIIGVLAWRIHARRRRGIGAWIALIGIPFALHAAFNLIQAVGGVRTPLGAGFGTEQWISVAIAGTLVWTAAALAIRYYRAEARAARRQGGSAR